VRDAPLDGCGIAIRGHGYRVLGSILAILVPLAVALVVGPWSWLNGGF